MTWLVSVSLAAVLAAEPVTPEEQALAYLAREVPRWSAENKCYSCHNNGDAARALYTAKGLAYAVPPRALADTTAWIAQPEEWKNNKGDPAFSDKGLARIQFAGALADALEAGALKDRKALLKAAELVAEGQQPDGSWKVDAPGSIGSPVTYGPCLATALASRTLRLADPARYRPAIARAEHWFQQVPVQTVLDAAAVLLALPAAERSDVVEAQRKRCWTLLRKGQSNEGGWGPYVNSPSEVFDTAVVLLALTGQGEQPDREALLQRGRAYLVAAQQADGSWLGTTRPSGGGSYAQHISTTGWATLALLATSDKRVGR